MFKLLLLFTSVVFSLSLLSQEKELVHEEELNKLTIELAVPYSFKLNNIGINSRLYYNLNEHVCLGPEVSYFKTKDLSIIDLNFVGHYIFEYKTFGFYPLAGLNYTIETEKLVREKEFGVVFGAGLHKSINKLFIFGEYAHVKSHLKDSFVTIGLMYCL